MSFLVGSLAQFIVSLGVGVAFYLMMSVVPELSSFLYISKPVLSCFWYSDSTEISEVEAEGEMETNIS